MRTNNRRILSGRGNPQNQENVLHHVPADKERGGPIAVRFDKVSFSYDTLPVLSDVSFHIHAGEFVALVGQNGAGKTTILKLLLGLEYPDDGSITLFENAAKAGYDRIGYVPQHADYDSTFPVSVQHVVRMGRLRAFSRRYTQEDDQAVREALERVEIADLAGRSYAALSGGQRRRVLVARALASHPDLLILDEPTANMDVESENRLFKTLGGLKGNTTIMIVTHDSSFVSSLTDLVLCVGDRTTSSSSGQGRTVVRHRAEPAGDAPVDMYGGHVFKVRHDVALPDNYCCEEDKKK